MAAKTGSTRIKLPPLKSSTTEKGRSLQYKDKVLRDVTPNCHNVKNLYFTVFIYNYCIYYLYLFYLYTIYLYLFKLHKFNQFILQLYNITFIVDQYMYFKFTFGIYFEGKACYVKFYAYMY